MAFGYGKQIGFTALSEDTEFRGYKCGSSNILYDLGVNFDKWSRCYEISKNLEIEEIVSILKEKIEENED